MQYMRLANHSNEIIRRRVEHGSSQSGQTNMPSFGLLVHRAI
jgi:hypothetical protein